jgi:ketosteroid isomerase-like protein
MNDDAEKVVREIYEAFGRGDLAALLARVSETARWDFAVAASEVPWHAPATGHVEITGFLTTFAEHVTIHAVEPRRFLPSGADVVVDVRIAYTVKRTGRRVDEDQLVWWTVADGKVTRLRHFEDTAQVLAAWRGEDR